MHSKTLSWDILTRFNNLVFKFFKLVVVSHYHLNSSVKGFGDGFLFFIEQIVLQNLFPSKSLRNINNQHLSDEFFSLKAGSDSLILFFFQDFSIHDFSNHLSTCIGLKRAFSEKHLKKDHSD